MLNLPRIFRKAAPADPPSQGPHAGAATDTTSHHIEHNAITIHAPANDEVAELDRLYQQALDAMEAVETELNRTNDLLNVSAETGAADDDVVPALDVAAQTTIGHDSTRSIPVVAAAGNSSMPVAVGAGRVTPMQIIEAALFVGGAPLTIKRLCTLLKGEFDQDFVESTVEQLNAHYAAECRPYEIRFGTGGYRMELRESFETVQNRVFGIGPKEVRLGQDALEILSLVAYRQPISKEAIDSHVRSNSGNILRQLLQRELIALRRDAGDGQEVTYHTTPRFLQVFGLAELSELPQAEELSFK